MSAGPANARRRSTMTDAIVPRARSNPSTASPTACGSSASSSGSARRSATSNARRCGSGSTSSRRWHVGQQVGKRSEGELRLRFDGAALRAPRNPARGDSQALTPQGRLADPRLAGDQQRGRPAMDPAKLRTVSSSSARPTIVCESLVKSTPGRAWILPTGQTDPVPYTLAAGPEIVAIPGPTIVPDSAQCDASGDARSTPANC